MLLPGIWKKADEKTKFQHHTLSHHIAKYVLYLHLLHNAQTGRNAHTRWRKGRRKKRFNCWKLHLCSLGTDFIPISAQFLKQHWQRHLQWWIMLLEQDCTISLGTCGMMERGRIPQQWCLGRGGKKKKTPQNIQTEHIHTKGRTQLQLARAGPASRKVTRSGAGGTQQRLSYDCFSSIMDHFINRLLLPNTSSL